MRRPEGFDTLGPLITGEYAARLYWAKAILHDRQVAKTGQLRPMGHRDAYGRWWPHPQEVQECCRYVKHSTKYPYTLRKHCCTLRHIARLCGVTERDLREERPKQMLVHC